MNIIQSKNVILYELNEVPQRVFDHYKTTRPRSHIAQLLAEGVVHSTHAADEGILSPWITWPTTHRGVSNTRHCISDFGQDLSDVNRDFPPVWELLARAGVPVGQFGSLHSYPLPESLDSYKFYVPDTFAAGSECFPETLTCFQDLNLRMVDASARNVAKGFPAASALRFLTQAPRLGIRASTALKIAKQLVAERMNRTRVVRRRTTQVQLAFDLFLKQLRTTRPAFSTFFTNHVASAMHRYWPATFRNDHKKLDLPEAWYNQFASEIDFTMGEADHQVGRLMHFVQSHDDYALIVVTSMGQAAVEGDVIHTQLTIADLPKFLRALGSPHGLHERQRAMLPRYVLRPETDSVAAISEGLRGMRVNGVPVEWVDHGKGVLMFKLGQHNLSDESINISIHGQERSWRDIGLANTKIQDATGSYAYHIPQGVMIVFGGKPCAEATEIPTSEICPMLLRNFGVRLPSYMRSPG